MAFRIAHSAAEWRAGVRDERRTVVSVGNFDGLHIGHQKILKAMVERARQEGRIAAAITFDPHPLKILRPQAAPPLIMTIGQRLAGFAQFGLDAALVIRFDEALAHVPAEEFVRNMLVETVRADAILVGANFRFGHQQTGDVALLTRLGVRYGFAVEIVEPAEVNGKLVSSTAIRQAIADGNVEEAGALLGYTFVLTGTVQSGAGRGAKIVFPTLNLAAEQELLPARGVYATETFLRGKLYRSVTNVGVRPTFDGHGITVESHLFDFSDTITSGAMEVRFRKRLREERKFPDAEALRAQIALDITTAKSYFDDREKARTHSPPI
jgi:riboflavin kinase/FMN adenylyltransferase